MMKTGIGLGLATTLALGLAACAPLDPGAGSKIEAQAATGSPAVTRDLHARIAVLDSHLDIPAKFHDATYRFGDRGSFEADGTQVDLPRMNEGGLDGGFFVIYTAQGPLDAGSYQAARNLALLRQMSIREMAARYADAVELAFSADDAERILDEGKKVVFQSMENAYPLGTDLSLLETFYIGGLRMVSPAHFRNNQFADSATDVTERYGGLSPEGEALVREANRLGMILDGSHASDATVADMMELSTTPLILSHSGPRTIYDHPRNIPDALMLAVAADGGVIQINALGAYLEALEPTPERAAALADLTAQFGSDPAAISVVTMAEFRAARTVVDKAHPAPRSTFEKFMEHVLYTLQLVGPDHVGIGADWDGGGGVDGMADVSALPRVTQALLDAGYSEADIAKIWGGNMLALMRSAEAARTAQTVSPRVVN